MDIIYVASLYRPLGKTLFETVMLEAVQGGPVLVQDYPGSFAGGGNGFFSMRANHFTAKQTPSQIYQRTVGSDNPMNCAEKRVVLCDSKNTKEVGEGFLMVGLISFIVL
jgi:hypothetical protein